MVDTCILTLYRLSSFHHCQSHVSEKFSSILRRFGPSHGSRLYSHTESNWMFVSFSFSLVSCDWFSLQVSFITGIAISERMSWCRFTGVKTAEPYSPTQFFWPSVYMLSGVKVELSLGFWLSLSLSCGYRPTFSCTTFPTPSGVSEERYKTLEPSFLLLLILFSSLSTSSSWLYRMFRLTRQ